MKNAVMINRFGDRVGLALLVLAAVAVAAPGHAAVLESPLILVDNQHVDLEVPYQGGQWNVYVDADDDGPRPTNGAILYLNSRTRTTRANWESWIGASPGQTVWIAEQGSQPGEIYLGWASTGCGPMGFWLPDDSRLSTPFSYIEISLVDIRGFDTDADPANNPAPPGDFALWETDGYGNKTPWISTAEAPADGNRAFILAGGHSHFSWAFTAEGLYELDFQMRACRSGGGMITSDVFTFVFGVERPLPGDANLDDQVSALDAAALAANWLTASSEVGWLEGDFNNDRRVDDLDASIMAANWTASAEGQSVPEPPAAILLLSTAGLLLGYQARRKQQGGPDSSAIGVAKRQELSRRRACCP
ncbi:MAG: choice-of-anchor M domain-containing protein [Pirellulales bacterium]|nr:choice-of-anchor M domain-containing protein [Pirellulales bacterium]